MNLEFLGTVISERVNYDRFDMQRKLVMVFNINFDMQSGGLQHPERLSGRKENLLKLLCDP